MRIHWGATLKIHEAGVPPEIVIGITPEGRYVVHDTRLGMQKTKIYTRLGRAVQDVIDGFRPEPLGMAMRGVQSDVEIVTPN
ncbi:hypothetical protein D6833_09160 [Candidatus Parcubacteria bacterium]|nr:MAG: hypothetical protein D6833_09160 [Candidatus Parcubacteria bacterium]